MHLLTPHPLIICRYFLTLSERTKTTSDSFRPVPVKLAILLHIPYVRIFFCSLLLLTSLNSPAYYPLPLLTFFCSLSSCLLYFCLFHLLIFHLLTPPPYLPLLTSLLLTSPTHFPTAYFPSVYSSCSSFSCLYPCLPASTHQSTTHFLAHFPSVYYPPSCSPFSLSHLLVLPSHTRPAPLSSAHPPPVLLLLLIFCLASFFLTRSFFY